MAYQEEQVRIKRKNTQQAIELAMQGRWREAIEANKSLIASFGNDVDAYNRLGRAYMELGEFGGAREAYQRALKADPYNVIARKNLSRLSRLNGALVATEESAHKVEPQSFIEETGKTGVVNLYRLGADSVLASTVAGDPVELRMEGASLVVLSNRGEYIGEVEPRHAYRLIRLMKGGNRYGANIISTDGAVTTIIREVYQDPSQMGHLSFPPRGFERLRPYVSERLFRREMDYEEEEEPGYVMDGGDEAELFSEEPRDIDEGMDSEV